jgi:polyhydroxyalkanoate synthesis regulator phasin
MADQLTRKDIQEVQKQIDDLSKQMSKLEKEVPNKIAEGDAKTERFIMDMANQLRKEWAPLEGKIAAIEKRLSALED